MEPTASFLCMLKFVLEKFCVTPWAQRHITQQGCRLTLVRAFGLIGSQIWSQMDRAVPSTQKNLEGLGSVSIKQGLRTASSLYSSVRSPQYRGHYFVLTRLGTSLQQNGAGAVALRLSRWLHLSALKIIFGHWNYLLGRNETSSLQVCPLSRPVCPWL